MKRLVFAVGVLALGVAASVPARAHDFAVIRFKDGHCQAWMGAKMGPWSPGAVYLAAGLKSWKAAEMKGKWEVKHHRCRSWS